MGAYDSMKNRLKPTGLYTLDGSTAVDFELQAMAEGLDAAYCAVEELRKESFIATAESWGLAGREEISGLDGTGSMRERRTKLLALGAAATQGFTKTALTALLCGIGLDAELSEDAVGGKVTAYFLAEPACGRESAQKILEKFMPAHLTAVSDFTRIS